MKKICTGCGKSRPLEEFPADNRNKTDGKLAQCKPCRNAYYGRYRKLHRERRKAWNDVYRVENSLSLYVARVNRLLGTTLTAEDYEAKLAEQGGACAICRCPETNKFRGKVRRLAFDHCHASGRIRDLICAACNRAIGLMRDSPDRLRAAADYLERHCEPAADREAVGCNRTTRTLPAVRRPKSVLHR